MARFLVQLEMRSEQPAALHRNARRYLSLTRVAVQRAGATLEDCWFSREGEQIVAMVSIDSKSNEYALRMNLERTVPVADITLTELVPVEEVLPELTDENLEYGIAELLDPVDLASALSFPASDPPAWPEGQLLEGS